MLVMAESNFEHQDTDVNSATRLYLKKQKKKQVHHIHSAEGKILASASCGRRRQRRNSGNNHNVPFIA